MISVRKILKSVWQDDFTRRGFKTGFFLWLSSLFLTTIFGLKLPPQIPLFYSRPWGEDQLASPIFIFILPASVFLILVVNLIIAGFFTEEKFLLRTLALASTLSSFLAFFALIKIIILSV